MLRPIPLSVLTLYADLVQQAETASLIDALRESAPFALEDALKDARARGRSGWAQPIERSLREIDRSL